MFASDDRDADVTPDLVAVLAEISRVDARRGYEHDVPIGSVRSTATLNAMRTAIAACDTAEREGRPTYLDALAEEVAEVAAEDEPQAVYRELVQVVTVAARAMRALRRRAEEASTP